MEVMSMALLMKPEPFSREIDRIFDSFFGTSDRGVRRWIPPMDLVEADDHFVLKADLPGLSDDDVAIEVHDGTLRISGERKNEHEQRESGSAASTRLGRVGADGFHRVERSFGSFSRSLTLPDGIDPDSIKAEFHDGVLEVRIPKPEERKPRRIAISSGNGKPAALEGTAQEK
jgi:HSP20 family protein